jgi:hypothetical protein
LAAREIEQSIQAAGLPKATGRRAFLYSKDFKSSGA